MHSDLLLIASCVAPHPRGDVDHGAFETPLRSLADDITLLAAEWFDTGPVADAHHLDGEGRERFTRQLLPAVAPSGS